MTTLWRHSINARRASRFGMGSECQHQKIWVCLKMSCTPLYPMVLLIIIPTKWLFHWGYTPFSDIPISGFSLKKWLKYYIDSVKWHTEIYESTEVREIFLAAKITKTPHSAESICPSLLGPGGENDPFLIISHQVPGNSVFLGPSKLR